MIIKTVRNILSLIYPCTCYVCGKPLLDFEQCICDACTLVLPRTNYDLRTPNQIYERLDGTAPFETATAHFIYQREGIVASLVHDFKYHKRPSIAYRMGQILAEDLKLQGFPCACDTILPMPMYWWKQCLRGYNQCHHIARGIADACGITVSKDLRATRSHISQTRLSSRQRRTNLKDSFSLRNPEQYAHRHIILLDDICTTGSTLYEALSAIHAAAPTCRVTVVALCMAV